MRLSRLSRISYAINLDATTYHHSTTHKMHKSSRARARREYTHIPVACISVCQQPAACSCASPVHFVSYASWSLCTSASALALYRSQRPVPSAGMSRQKAVSVSIWTSMLTRQSTCRYLGLHVRAEQYCKHKTWVQYEYGWDEYIVRS